MELWLMSYSSYMVLKKIYKQQTFCVFINKIQNIHNNTVNIPMYEKITGPSINHFRQYTKFPWQLILAHSMIRGYQLIHIAAL